MIEKNIEQIKDSLKILVQQQKQNKQAEIPKWLLNVNITVQEFSRITGKSSQTILDNVRRQKIKHLKNGKIYTIPVTELIKYVEFKNIEL